MIPSIDMAALALRYDRISEFSALLRAGESSASKQDVGPPVQVVGGVAFIGLKGFVVARPSWLTALGLATSSMQLTQATRAAVANPKVKAVVFDVDSPGGIVLNTDESAAAIAKLRGSKPMVAVAQGLMCSAAYWLSSSADEILASPSSDIGSIGVFSVHQSVAGALEKEGIETTLISSTPQKVAGNPYQSLTPEARAEIESRVADIYGEFLSRVAVNRKVSVATVKASYGKGASFRGRAALGMGMVDGLIDDMGAVGRYLQSTGAFAKGFTPTVVSDHDATCDILCAAGWGHLAKPRSAPLAPAVARSRQTPRYDSDVEIRRMKLALREKQMAW